MEIILSAKDIYKTYKSASGEVRALNGVSIDFEKGLFYAVIGRSGSGKSTLLHILSGLDRPTRSTVSVAGTDFSAYSDEKMAIFRRRHMGFVFQQYNLLDEYNVHTNITMPLKLDGRRAGPRFLREVTEQLGLADKLKKYPSELSGGEQQRCAIARCVLAKPHLIFADEPTGNLDKRVGEEAMGLLRDSARRFGQTLVVVTHDLDIARTADAVVHIEDGKIV